MTEGEITEEPSPSIWAALQTWAGTLRPWGQYAVALAVNNGRLDQAQVEAAYQLFLTDKDLASPTEQVAIEAPAFATRPPGALADSLVLVKVDGIQGLNALPSGAYLTFGAALTVVFGRNGAGKSGFARLFGNIGFCRQPMSILPDIYAEGEGPALDATFHLVVAGAAVPGLRMAGGDDLSPLRRLSVFDAAVARHHITQTSAFEFKPAGFDVFPEVTRVYGEIGTRLDAEITKRTRENTYPQAFLGGGTIVHEAVSALGADTDIPALRALAAYGAAESARLTELDSQLTALRSQSPKEVLAQLKEAVADIETLTGGLRTLAAEFDANHVAERRRLVDDAREKRAAAATLGSDQFRRPFFAAVGTLQWEAFAQAAHTLARQESANYPQGGDHCLLCERRFDDNARQHVEALLQFVESDARQVATEALAKLSQEAEALAGLDLTLFGPATRVRGHVTRLSPEHAKTIADAFDALAKARVATRADLADLSATEAVADVQGALDALASLHERSNADIARLAADNTDASIASLEEERRVLRHRHVLSQQIDQMVAFVEDAKWVKKAGKTRSSLSTRAITDKEKELFGQIIGESYRERLAAECDGLECKVPVELQTVGRSGQTVRSLAMPGGHKPDTILSEGEQRAVALADFLTEVAQNPGAAGIVLDDPVNSLDHQRRQLIAKRLVKEATSRQVIVFTHDLVFLNELALAAEDDDVELVGHWVDRDNEGRPGKVALDDSPATAKLHETTKRAEEALARAKLLSGSARETEIRTGMGALRRTLEETVVRRLFKGVVPRWSDRVIITALLKINWDQAKVQELCDLFEDLSRYIEGHSHTDEASGAPPEPAELESRIAKVNGLIKWARSDRAK